MATVGGQSLKLCGLFGLVTIKHENGLEHLELPTSRALLCNSEGLQFVKQRL